MNDDIKKKSLDSWDDIEKIEKEVQRLKLEHAAMKQMKMQKDIDLMEGFYEASIKQAEKILNSVQVGEIIHINEYGKRLFEIVSKSSALQVKVKDVKTGQILQIYANQIEKLDKKPEMIEILYEKP